MVWCGVAFSHALLEGDDGAREGLFHGAATRRPAASAEEAGAKPALSFLLVLKCGLAMIDLQFIYETQAPLINSITIRHACRRIKL